MIEARFSSDRLASVEVSQQHEPRILVLCRPPPPPVSIELLNIMRYPGARWFIARYAFFDTCLGNRISKGSRRSCSSATRAPLLEERREVDELPGHTERSETTLYSLLSPWTGAPRSFILNSIHAIEFYITFPPSDEQLRIDYKRATWTPSEGEKERVAIYRCGECMFLPGRLESGVVSSTMKKLKNFTRVGGTDANYTEWLSRLDGLSIVDPIRAFIFEDSNRMV